MGRPLGGTAAGQARGAVGRPLRGWPAERWEDRWMLLGVFSRATAAARSSKCGQSGTARPTAAASVVSCGQRDFGIDELLHLLRSFGVSVHTIHYLAAIFGARSICNKLPHTEFMVATTTNHFFVFVLWTTNHRQWRPQTLFHMPIHSIR